MDKLKLTTMLKSPPAVELMLYRATGGYIVMAGNRALKTALSSSDEVVVSAMGIGPMLVFKAPDGQLNIARDERVIPLFMKETP